MALYNDSKFLAHNTDKAFTVEHNPGAKPPHSGIYRCMGCGKEIVAEESRQFPPQNHHEHSPAQGKIRWRMIVYADHDPK
ncbi:protein L [Mucilaginibacter rubeus]|uniref:protein L n=1 Tax=Mucilaginibacter rubeus TaxID=2027860 RepID=UPI00166E9688|nr:protein L [Mucilaginibacter rubeus]